MDLESLKAELFRRLEFSDTEKEKTYQSERDTINKKFPDEGWHIPQAYIDAMKNLKNSKLREIRKDLNDDAGFNRLVSELENVKANKEKKEVELKSLVPPNQPNFSQKLYTSVFGKENTADAEINAFNVRTKNIQNEIADFQKIISDIETLKPIYNETQGGSKTKIRRNRNSNKSRKKLRKSSSR